jgi:glucose uptake protein GlcU
MEQFIVITLEKKHSSRTTAGEKLNFSRQSITFLKYISFKTNSIILFGAAGEIISGLIFKFRKKSNETTVFQNLS